MIFRIAQQSPTKSFLSLGISLSRHTKILGAEVENQFVHNGQDASPSPSEDVSRGGAQHSRCLRRWSVPQILR